jgi:hypothetical protein
VAAFVARLLELFEDGDQRAALKSGRLRFRLAAAPASSLTHGMQATTGSSPHATRDEPAVAGASPAPAGRDVPIDSGAVTERFIDRQLSRGDRLILGHRAVVTPLARDRARALGISIERKT